MMLKPNILRLIEDSLLHLGVEATLPNGKIIQVLFKAADSLYESSQNDFIGTTGIVEVQDANLESMPNVGLVFVIGTLSFKVISEPLLDQSTRLWQMQVMEI